MQYKIQMNVHHKYLQAYTDPFTMKLEDFFSNRKAATLIHQEQNTKMVDKVVFPPVESKTMAKEYMRPNSYSQNSTHQNN